MRKGAEKNGRHKLAGRHPLWVMSHKESSESEQNRAGGEGKQLDIIMLQSEKGLSRQDHEFSVKHSKQALLESPASYILM